MKFKVGDIVYLKEYPHINHLYRIDSIPGDYYPENYRTIILDEFDDGTAYTCSYPEEALEFSHKTSNFKLVKEYLGISND